mgnify:CR=1 FL=1
MQTNQIAHTLDDLHSAQTMNLNDGVAHCITGQARSITLPCVRDALARNVFAQFPEKKQAAFVHFSTAPASKLNLLRKVVVDTENVSLLKKLAWSLPFVKNVSVGPATVPSCLAQRVRDAATILMWNSIRACFDMVRVFEKRNDIRFGTISRLRPDAVFFAALPSVQLSLPVAWIPKGGLLQGCSRCANDHLAIVHREVAELYFEGIAKLSSNCDSGVQFNLRWNSVRLNRSVGVGEEIHFGPGFGYHSVGLPVRSFQWPYALSARKCVRASCMSLQCQRVTDPELRRWCTRWTCKESAT